MQGMSIRKKSSFTVKPHQDRALFETVLNFLGAQDHHWKLVLGAATYWGWGWWADLGAGWGSLMNDWRTLNYPLAPTLALYAKKYIFLKCSKQFQGVHRPLRNPTPKSRSTLSKQVVPAIRRAKCSPLRARYHIAMAAARNFRGEKGSFISPFPRWQTKTGKGFCLLLSAVHPRSQLSPHGVWTGTPPPVGGAFSGEEVGKRLTTEGNSAPCSGTLGSQAQRPFQARACESRDRTSSWHGPFPPRTSSGPWSGGARPGPAAPRSGRSLVLPLGLPQARAWAASAQAFGVA